MGEQQTWDVEEKKLSLSMASMSRRSSSGPGHAAACLASSAKIASAAPTNANSAAASSDAAARVAPNQSSAKQIRRMVRSASLGYCCGCGIANCMQPTFKCCSAQQQLCCLVSQGAFPTTDEMPCLIGCCGLSCYPNVGCCKSLKDI